MFETEKSILLELDVRAALHKLHHAPGTHRIATAVRNRYQHERGVVSSRHWDMNAPALTE